MIRQIRVIFLLLVVVEDHRHLRQPLDRAQIGVAERGGQLDGDDLRLLAQDRSPHLDGEFEFPRDHRKVREPAAPEAARIR